MSLGAFLLMTYVANRNPRFNRFFRITIDFDGYSLSGQAINPSAFGASIEISALAYEHLKTNAGLWENGRRVKAVTSLNDLPASVNSIFITDEKFFISLKLLDGRTWYQ